jgi:hypothetical protein
MIMYEPNINLDSYYINKKMLREALTPFIECAFINDLNRELARKILYEGE